MSQIHPNVHWKLGGAKRLMCSLLPTLVVLVVGEFSVRIHYFRMHGNDMTYLTVPFGTKKKSPTAPVEYPYKPTRTYTRLDACSGRELTFTVNRQGGRGPAWSAVKPPNTVRMMALGASTTFGVNNPDDATWPALLERALKRQGVRAEVLNLGIPGMRLDEMVRDLPTHLRETRPDIVLYYEAFNNATAHWDAYHSADVGIERFHAHTWVGRLTVWLHYRSMLYTYLLEKSQFYRATRDPRIVPEIDYFRTQLRQFVRIIRDHHAIPIFVLQVTEVPPEGSFQRLQLGDHKAVEAAILQATKASAWTRIIDEEMTDQQFTVLRAYQTQVLVELVRRTGEAEGVQVIDPRSYFTHQNGDPRFFCDVVHLTDAGNHSLAAAIAEQLDVTSESTPVVASHDPAPRSTRQRDAL